MSTALARFRHMMVSTGVKPSSISDDELMEMAKPVGGSQLEKLTSMEQVTSLVPETYWQKVGL